jgi:hypothetical protein
MRGIHTSITITVAAAAILLVALVVLNIFGFGMSSVSTLAEAGSQCSMQGVSTCQATAALPATWNSPSVFLNNAVISCREATGCGSCSCILGGGEVRDFEPGEEFHSGDFSGRGIGIELPEDSIDIALENLEGL